MAATHEESGYDRPLIPALAVSLVLLALPTTGGDGRSRRRPRSSILCDAWTMLSSVVVLIVSATCDLTYDGSEALLSSSASAAAPSSAEEEASEIYCEGDCAVCDDPPLKEHDANRIHPSMDEVSDAITEHCRLAAFILGTAMVLELLQVVAHRVVAGSNRDAVKVRRCDSVYTMFGCHDSECLLLVYALLFLTHIFMSNDRGGEMFGVIFAEPLAAMDGYYRPVSTIRYVEWAIASPLVMSLIGRSIPRVKEASADVSRTLRPALVVTISYIFTSWLAMAVVVPVWRWTLISVALMGYLLSVADQLTAWKIDADETALCARAYDMLLLVQILSYGAYGAIFLLSLFGYLDPIAEQAALTYADATIKLMVSASLAAMRHADSLAEARRERAKADGIASDLRRIIHDANAPIFALDAEGNVNLWNSKLARLTGSTLADVVGKPLVDFMSQECREEFREVFEARKKGRMGTEQYHCDMICQHDKKGGKCEHNETQLASLLMTATARHDAEGNFVGIVGIGSDLTEVTRIKAVEEKKNQFMAVVSHELKSPLHGIIGLSESLSQSEKSPDRKGRLKMVKSCAIRLLDLVSNIMQMSRLNRDKIASEDSRSSSSCDGSVHSRSGSARRQKLRKDPVDIPSIINEVCVLVTNATDKGNCPLLNPLVKFENRLEQDARLPIVEGDAYKITQVFYNILTNACKFCTHGSITIDAGVNEARDMLEVSVTDTGIGINPENVKRIFEPFEQEINTSRRRFGGIGLGLAISKQVIELHGGDVFVASTPGKGSKFTISLPVTEEAVALCDSVPLEVEQSQVSTTNSLQGEAKPTGSLQRLQRRGSAGAKPIILSVDDDIVNQEVIRSSLSDKYELHVAMNGFEALEYFSTRSKLPDLVLLDVMMPGMDGFEVLKEIREEKKISPTNLPVIMLSAMEPVDKSLIQSLRAGANDYVTKPFDPDILKARVSTAVEMRRLRKIEDENFHYSKLLHDILPSHIVERLILGDRNISERHESVCMLFSDIVGWTPMSESLPTQQLVDLLNQLFSEFDTLTEKHGVFKADTIGDAYIVAAGHEGQATCPNATLRVAEFAMDMLEKVKSIRPPNGMQLQIRVGIHTGPAFSGVVGTKVPKYTFFGDTVNTAARLEQTGVVSCINMSNSARQALASGIAPSGRSLEGWLSQMGASIVSRGPIKVKGKGELELYLLCPKGVSSPLAMRLSKSALNASMKSDSTLENADLLVREAKLKEEIDRLRASNQEAWAEVEILRMNLTESARIATQDTKIGKELLYMKHSYQPTRTMSHRRNSLGSLSSSPQPMVAPSYLQQIEELKIQLLVTTKSLARARQALMHKDDEIDEMDLQLLRIKSQLPEGTKDELHSLDQTGVISASTSTRRTPFISRTQKLLETSSQDPLITLACERLSCTLDQLGDFKDKGATHPK